MKKLLLFAAAALVAMVSCSKSDSDSSFSTPKYKDEAVKYQINVTSTCPVMSVEFTSSGKYVVGLWKSLAKGTPVAVEYITGNFTKDGDVYKLEGFGTVTIGAAGTANFTISVDGGNTYNVSATPVDTGNVPDSDLFRTWKVKTTQVSVVISGVTAAKTFKACNLEDIKAFIEEQEINGKKIVVDDKFDVSYSVEDITITPAGTFIINYKNGKSDVASCDFSAFGSGKFTYDWDIDDMGFSFENGKADFKFTKGLAVISLGADIKYNGGTYNAGLTLYLTEI